MDKDPKIQCKKELDHDFKDNYRRYKSLVRFLRNNYSIFLPITAAKTIDWTQIVSSSLFRYSETIKSIRVYII